MRLAALAVACVCGLAVVPAAIAKDGVEATLAAPLRLDTPAGSPVEVRVTLASRDGSRFSALGVFVRVRSATSGRLIEAAADEVAHGEYATRFTMPVGGIDDLVVGLAGIQSSPAGTARADALFPITNDPFPGRPREVTSERSTTWPLLLGALVLLGALALGIARRRGGRAHPVGDLRAARVASSGPDRPAAS